MQSDTRVIGRSADVEFSIDLKDFPHGELDSVRKDDKYDIEFYNVPDGVQVPSYNSATGKTEWRQAKYWSVHRGKKLEIVTLSGGSQIYTDDDPRAVYGYACDAEKAEPTRFTPTEALEKKVIVPISSEILADGIKRCYYDFASGDIVGEKPEHGCQIGFSFGQFVGVMVGDGWKSEHEVYLADNEGFNAEFISAFLKLVYGDAFYYTKDVFKKADFEGRYGDTTRYRLNAGTVTFASRIKELVDGHGDDMTSGSANKRLPPWFQFAGRDFVLGLVCGMIATDGTVALSHGKEKPQLRIQYTSTSLRLAREFQRCCRLLGVKCSVGFSKRTSGGNEAWNCTVSTVDAKKAGLLDRCCHERKRDVFKSAEVMTGDQFVKNDFVPFPKDVSAEIVRLVPAVKDASSDDEKAVQSLCIGVRKYATTGRVSRSVVRSVASYGKKVADANEEACRNSDRAFSALLGRLEKAKAGISEGRSLKFLCAEVSPEDAELLRLGTEARRHRLSGSGMVPSILKMLFSVRKSGKMTWAQAMQFVDFVSCTPPATELRDSAALAWLMDLAESDVRWEVVERVEKTGVEVLGYDLTVPGYDTFVNADGVVLSNTVNIHVPASEEASKEALEKMLPSKNLFSLTDMKSTRYKPEKEHISGLWALTRGKSKKPVKRFRTKAEAIAAYRHGEIAHDDPVEIG